jgi:predicted flavoprotein YhiN
VLQASSYSREGETLQIVWFDESKWREICDADANRARTVDNLLTEFFPAQLAREFARQLGLQDKKWAEVSGKKKAALLDLLAHWSVKPAGTLGWNKAEVMVGGVDTTALDSRTMMVKSQPGLFFIGECVDVTGHLGGHNFQWAWSSAYVCAHGLL